MTAPAENKPAGKPLDEFGRMALDRLIQTVNEYNNLAAQVKAATGDPGALLDTLRESYNDDETVVKIRAAIEQIDDKREALVNQMDAILKPIVEQRVEQAKSGLGNSEEVAKELLKTVNAGKKYITDLFGEEAISDLPPLVSVRKTAAGGDGRSGQRIRGFNFSIDGNLITMKTKVDGKEKVTSNLAAVAKHLGVETTALREQFQAAAGGTDPKNYPARVEFTIGVGEGDERKQVTVVGEKQQDESTTESAPAEANNQEENA